MSLPSLPDWLPWWVPILVAIPLGLWVLTMLVMPFSVIGVKSRLEGIEARLDELQGELRSLVLRLPELPAERVSYGRSGYDPPPIDQGYVQPEPPRPPIPPDRRGTGFIPRQPNEPPRGDDRRDRPGPAPRAEPRLDWRR